MSMDKVKVFNTRSRISKIEQGVDLKRRKDILEKYLSKQQLNSLHLLPKKPKQNKKEITNSSIGSKIQMDHNENLNLSIHPLHNLKPTRNSYHRRLFSQ